VPPVAIMTFAPCMRAEFCAEVARARAPEPGVPSLTR
jgi:hypothetical protein